MSWDWKETDLSVESQTHLKLAESIQRRVILDLISPTVNPPWDVVFDDDDTNEAADIVAIRSGGDRLIIHFYHCKISRGDAPGVRVADLYEVCGQAQRSIRWKADVAELFRHLRVRHESRLTQKSVGRFETGDLTVLSLLNKQARLLPTDFTVFIVQPGLSRGKVSAKQLDLLAATELYLKETSSIDLGVIGSV